MIKEKKKTETIKREVVISREYFCDKCGGEIERDSIYSRDSFYFKLRKGEVYEEGGCIEEEHAYFCEKCAYEIKDILERQGIKFYEIDIYY